MSSSTTVVIGAAGLGTRLGMNTPKALVEVGGKPLIQHHLEALADVYDIVIVVGYMAREFVEVVRDLRPSATIAFNHNFTTTGTAASVAKGAFLASDYVLSLDGDLLVNEADLKKAIDYPGPLLGLTPTESDEPVCAKLSNDGELVTELSQDWKTEWEWSGLVKLPKQHALELGTGHVFHGFLRRLPLPYIEIDCIEIDHPEDMDKAEVWLERHKGN